MNDEKSKEIQKALSEAAEHNCSTYNPNVSQVIIQRLIAATAYLMGAVER